MLALTNLEVMFVVAVVGALCWLFGWLLGRSSDKRLVRRWQTDIDSAYATRDAALARMRKAEAHRGENDHELLSLRDRADRQSELVRAAEENARTALDRAGALQTSAAESDERLGRLHRELQAREETIRMLEAEREAETERLARAVADGNRDIDDLRARVRGLEPLRVELLDRDRRIEELAATQERCEESEHRLRSLQETHDHQLGERDREIEALRGRVADGERTLAELRSEHDGCAATIAGLQARLGRAAGAAEPEETPTRHPRDNLKRIRGIGLVFERHLNALGYYTFRDIAGWSSEDIERVAKSIDTFPDRIRRDNWIDQARDFEDEAAT